MSFPNLRSLPRSRRTTCGRIGGSSCHVVGKHSDHRHLRSSVDSVVWQRRGKRVYKVGGGVGVVTDVDAIFRRVLGKVVGLDLGGSDEDTQRVRTAIRVCRRAEAAGAVPPKLLRGEKTIWPGR
jgi:hypothetical protein